MDDFQILILVLNKSWSVHPSPLLFYDLISWSHLVSFRKYSNDTAFEAK